MAEQEHIERLKRSGDEWNRWRRENPPVRPQLDGAHLGGCDLNMYSNLSVVCGLGIFPQSRATEQLFLCSKNPGGVHLQLTSKEAVFPQSTNYRH